MGWLPSPTGVELKVPTDSSSIRKLRLVELVKLNGINGDVTITPNTYIAEPMELRQASSMRGTV